MIKISSSTPSSSLTLGAAAAATMIAAVAAAPGERRVVLGGVGMAGGATVVTRAGIVIDLGDCSWRVERADQAVPILTELLSKREVSVRSYRDASLRLGRAMMQVKGQVPHGDWLGVVHAMGINQRTMQACMRRARKFADEQGRLDLGRVNEAKSAHVVRISEAGLARIGAGRPSVRDLDQLSRVSRPVVKAVGKGWELDGEWGDEVVGERTETVTRRSGLVASAGAGVRTSAPAEIGSVVGVERRSPLLIDRCPSASLDRSSPAGGGGGGFAKDLGAGAVATRHLSLDTSPATSPMQMLLEDLYEEAAAAVKRVVRGMEERTLTDGQMRELVEMCGRWEAGK